jgi:phenylpropionate dioxygenase-like ring-hydroxylating dioxygenase large terminal subunit
MRTYPLHAWYVVASSSEVDDQPLARRALDTAVVLYRLADGSVAALEDRDAHAPYPLSLGSVVDDLIVSAYSGFAYAPDGTCVRVPTQAEVPYGARVRAFPVREVDGLVWAWFAEPGVASLRQPPRTPWLADPAWETIGDAWTTAANFRLLHENFADITHVAVVDPVIAPPVLRGAVPDLAVEVTETSVSFTRDYPEGGVSEWLEPLIGVASGTSLPQREEGRFVGPGLWVDSWDFLADDPDTDGVRATFRFTHAVTPVDDVSTRHAWHVSRTFAPGAAVSENLRPLFTGYYTKVRDILETMQRVLTTDGPRSEVRVAADAAAVHVRRIVTRMVADERPS